MAEPAADLRAAAEAHERGVAAFAAGRPEACIAQLRTALDQLEGVEGAEAATLRTRVLTTMALPEFERGGLPGALPVLDAAARQAAALGDPVLVALCHSQRAALLGRSGDLAAARTSLDAAAAHLADLPPRDRWVLLLNRGMLASMQGDLTAAAADLGRAEDAASSHGLTREAAMALHNRGWIGYLAGDLPGALRLMSRAEDLAADVSEAVAQQDRGRVLLAAGLLGEAAEVLGSAIAGAADQGEQQVLAETQLELARAKGLLGDPVAGLALARAARDRFRRRGAPRWAARSEAVGIELALTRGTRPRAVAGSADRLVAAADQSGDPVLRHQAHLLAAQARTATGELDAAASHLRAAEQHGPVGVGAPLTTVLHHHQVSAVLHARRGEVAAARGVLRRAAAELARGQSLSASLDVRTALAVHGTNLSAVDLDLSLARGAWAVLDTTERWRATTARLPSVRPPASPELADLLSRLRILQEEFRQAPPDAAEVLQREAAAVRQRIQRHARTSGAAAAAHRDVIPPIRRPAAVAALSSEGADLLTLIGHRGRVLAVAVIDGRAHVHDLAAEAEVAEAARRVGADLRVAATHQLGTMRDAVDASLHAGLAALDRLLLAPLGSNADRVIVVPNGSTAALPWPMLPTLHGRGVVVAPSVTVWARGRAAHQGPVAVRALAGPHLQHAATEVRAVATCWPAAVVHEGPEATAGALQEALSAVDLVHVAAHGDHEHHHPLFAAVQMGDGPLHVHDVELTGVAAAHVVLSACDVGVATVRPGEEPLGMAAGLLALGARSVVAPVCRVPDELAAALMAAYHAGLARGVPGDVALAAATAGAPPLAGAFLVTGSPWRVAV